MDPKILEAIPGANPSGENLRYDTIYGEIRARVRRARGQVLPHPDDPDFDSTEEDWSFLVRACREVLKRRSKDLMIAAWLTEAQFAVDGFPGLGDGLEILRGLTETFWETLYPEIEDGDAEARLRVFEWLDMRLAEAVRSDSVYRLSRGVEPGDTSVAVVDKNASARKALSRQCVRDLTDCRDSLQALDDVCREKFAESAPRFSELRKTILKSLGDAFSDLVSQVKVQFPAMAASLSGEFRNWLSRERVEEILLRLQDEKRAFRADVQAESLYEKDDEELHANDPSDWPSASALPPPSAPAPSPNSQKVDFTLAAPAAVAPGIPFELFVWAHESQERARILARVREELNVRDVLARTKGPVRISSGTLLSVRLEIPGAVIGDPEDRMVWEGESTSVSFVVTLPESSRWVRFSGSAWVYANGVQVVRISFVVSVSGNAAGMAEAQNMRYRNAFASYASEDRDAVLGRIQGICKVAPEMEIFLDVVSLRSGQNWELELWRVIPASDIFYLFWSSHARKSKWVEKEWRCALRERGIEFIDPIPLESPAESPPPPELSSLHFNDWMLAFRRGNPPASH
ncbi:MAG: type VI secretion system ImpA family N-terminal domain-containing protein [Alloacidobacterium sp.]|jgi:hypothetical protein